MLLALLKSKLFKGGLTVGTTQIITQVCLLVQSVIYARLLPPSSVAVAATFLLTISILDLLRNVGLEKLVIQAEDGRSEAFQGSAHAFLLLRGCISGVLLFAFGGYAAKLFGTPDAAWAYRGLGLIPLIGGFAHLDCVAMQRNMRFGPSQKVEIFSNVGALICAAALARWTHSYVAAFWTLVARTFVSALASQLLSEKRYRLGWTPECVKRIVAFGWPLVINGILIFIVYQGDRFVIASASQVLHRPVFTLDDLAIFSVASAISGVLTGVLANISMATLFPYFSRIRSDPEIFGQRVRISMDGMAALSMIVTAGMAVAGPIAIGIVYGHLYSQCKAYFAWLVAAQSVRMLRIVPTTSTMAEADTKNAMYSNFVRMASLAIGFLTVSLGGGIAALSAVNFAGEACALALSLRLLKARQPYLLNSSTLLTVALAIASCLLLGLANTYISAVIVVAAAVFVALRVRAAAGLSRGTALSSSAARA